MEGCYRALQGINLPSTSIISINVTRIRHEVDLREEFKARAKCEALTKHFEHCQEKVHAG